MNAPTLLIGLGGTGCKIIERVSKMVTGEQRNNIAFAVFDTDINDLRGIQERNPFIKTIQTSTKQTVGEYLNKDTHARDTLLCEAQHNSVYLIMVVMRRTDVKTAPGEDSWRSCFT